jgi:hypothetical protein
MSIDCDNYDFTNNRPKTSFYNDIQEHMMTADSIVLVLINKVDKVWDEKT